MRSTEKSANTHIIRKAISTFLLMVLLAVAWFLTNNYNQLDSAQPAATLQCDFINIPCQIDTTDLQAVLSINGSDISAFTSLEFNFTLQGFAAETVSIDFQGVEMFMGSNQLNLLKAQNGSFFGVKTLPGHSDQSMTWRAIVKSTQGDQSRIFHFEFELQ